MRTILKKDKNELGLTVLYAEDTDDHSNVFSCITKLGIEFYITQFPTNNCQVSMLANAEDLFESSEVLDILKFLHKHDFCDWDGGENEDVYQENILSHQVLIDVKQNVLELIESKIAKKYFVFKQKYKSTNDSKMVMCLINLDKLFK